MAEIPVTQRAYTLRLRGESKDDQTWRDVLWQTHVAVNRGAKAFGDWLLTLRGGLCHTLADEKIPVAKNKPDRDPTEAERRHRRIILALSWLSVESHERESDAPTRFFVLDGSDEKPQTVAALRQILIARGVNESEIGDWVRDCGDSLKAAVRDSAVWVNRSQAFDEKVQQVGPSLTRAEIWDVFDRFFGNADSYLGTSDAPVDDAAKSEGEEGERGDDEAKPAADDKAKDLVIKAGGWLSNRFGKGEGADFSAVAVEYEDFAAWCRSEAVSEPASASTMLSSLTHALKKTELPVRLAGTSGPSNKVQTAFDRIATALKEDRVPDGVDYSQLATWSDEQASKKKGNVGGKGPRAWTDALLKDVETASGFTYIDPVNETARHWEYSVMLDHAARRMSQSHSWIKLAEGERREFEVDARKIDKVPPVIVEWLDKFCRDQSNKFGTTDDEGYRIRKRAIPDWSLVVAKWAKSDCLTAENRIEKSVEVLGDPENDKPGDNQLYEALAAEDAKLVWLVDGSATAQPLKDYVAAREAEHNKRRFKVPAYRHPDELRHPVFCDFGESRWSIDFAAHRSHSKVASAQASVQRRQLDLDKAQQALAKAKTEEKLDAARQKLTQAQRQLDDAQKQLAWLQSRQGLRMKLWNGSTLDEQPLTWQSKRLRNELTAPSPKTAVGASLIHVTRSNRLALAAADAKADARLDVLGLLDLKEWNGRLQVPRAELNRIADIRDGKKRKKLSKPERDECVAKMIAHLHWLVTYSARLQPQGPWMDYAKDHPDLVKPDPQYWPHAAENKLRKGRARRSLSHLPGLRLLSVDLGHRYAAACAVWEALGHQVFRDELALARKDGAEVCFGPLGTNEESAVYCHVKFPERVSKKATKKAIAEGRDKFQPVTVYRRIGSDALPDGSPHPAPWARLDRQFLVKLQGEDQPARAATLEERECVETLERELGHQRREPRKGGEWRIDELMSDVVRIVRLALYQHGDYARLASGLIATDKLGMGNRSAVKLAGEALDEHLLDLLERWHELAHSPRWTDTFAREKWQQHIAPRLGDKSLAEVTDDMTGPQRKATKNQLRGQLEPLAKQLAKENLTKLAAEWQQAWDARDQQWHKQLRSLNRWIMPRGKDVKGNSRKGDHSIRRVGGLSLNRIATFKSLYQVQKAFFTRLKPDGKKPDPAGEDFGQRTLMAMERMRQNRVKQLASRIAEAALGVGIEGLRGDRGRQLARPRERIAGPRFAPCHAVVIENLTHYKPDELQTRRENRQLMTWAAAQVKKHLSDQCQLHGLHLREVQPGYTSRQDSRTGAPGVRCNDIRVEDFPRRCARQLTAIAKKGANDPLARYLLALKQKYLDQDGQPKSESLKGILLRIPQKGGELFVSASAESSAAHGLQADLNAAANIGLRALLDPDWSGSWWYVPATRIENGDFTPKPESTSGSVALNGKQLRLKVADTSTADSATTSTVSKPRAKSGKAAKPPKGRDTVNLWCDVSTTNLDARDWQLIVPYTNATSEQVAGWLHAHDDRESVVGSSLTNEDNPF